MDIEKIHHWDVLAISCIDGRFIAKIEDWIKKQEGNVFDYTTEIGDSKAIIDSPTVRRELFDLIKTSKHLHHIKEIWLFDHVDCGAYGGSGNFENEEVEKNFHSKKLTEAAAIINEEFSHIKVRKFYADWEKIGELD